MQLCAHREHDREQRDRIARNRRENILYTGCTGDERIRPVPGAMLQCVQKFVKHRNNT